APLRRVAKDHVEDRVEVRLLTSELEAVIGELDRRLDETRPRERAERAVRRLEPRRAPGHGARSRTDVEDLCGFAVEVHVDRLHLRRRPGAAEPGSRDEEV